MFIFRDIKKSVSKVNTLFCYIYVLPNHDTKSNCDFFILRSLHGPQAKYYELETKPRIRHQTKGTISFVNNGNNMHGSQV